MSTHSSSPPRRFLNPWDHGALIRYLAFLRHEHAASAIPSPLGDHYGSSRVPRADLFVPPRVGVGAPDDGPAGSSPLDLLDALNLSRHMVLLGDAGSGRSTAVSWLVRHLTDPGRNPVIDRLGRLVPIVLPLRELDIDGHVRRFDELLELMGGEPCWTAGMDELVSDLLRRGQALIILDGVDTVSDHDAADAVRRAVLEGAARYRTCRWLLTAEPLTWLHDPWREEVDDVVPRRASLSALTELRAPELNAWHLWPFDASQYREYIARWQVVAGVPVGERTRTAAEMARSIEDSEHARPLARDPSMLALLVLVTAARGGVLPSDRAQFVDWLVAAWLALLDVAPHAERFPVPARRAWIEALANAAESGRIAVWGAGLGDARAHPPAVSVGAAARLLCGCVVEGGGHDPGKRAAAAFIEHIVRQPGILALRAGGVGFRMLEHQRFLAAIHLAGELHGDGDDGYLSSAALETLKGWSRMPGTEAELAELLHMVAARPDISSELVKTLGAPLEERTLAELDDLAPLALALADGADMGVPEALRDVARRLADETVGRWAGERRRVPAWTKDLRPVAAQVQLRSLDVSGCREVSDLRPLARLRRLERLDLQGCSSVTDLTPIQNLPALKWVDVRACETLTNIGPLSELGGLRWLDLGGCAALTDLSALSGLEGLQALALHGCTGLTDLKPLSAVRSLRALVISDCTGVTDLSPLRLLPRGGQVWVRGSGVRRVPADFPWAVIGLD